MSVCWFEPKFLPPNRGKTEGVFRLLSTFFTQQGIENFITTDPTEKAVAQRRHDLSDACISTSLY